MGTFHDDKHELHGITVVVDTSGPEVFVGRCDTMDDEQIYLLDVDFHRDGDQGRTKAEFLRRTAQFGQWKKFDRLTVPRDTVTSILPLADVEG